MGTYTQRDSPAHHAGGVLGLVFLVMIFAGAWAIVADTPDDRDLEGECRAACEHIGTKGKRFANGLGGSCLCSNGVRPFAW